MEPTSSGATCNQSRASDLALDLKRFSRPDSVIDSRPPTLRRSTMSGFIGTRFLLCTSLVFLAMLACGSAMAQVVSTNFEDGQTDGWFPRGAGTTLTLSTNQANTGTQSLLTTGRTQNFGGPSIDLTSALVPGQLYAFTI